jgi:hypothetical protein
MVVYEDGTVKKVGADGGEVTEFVDGTVQSVRDGKRDVVYVEGRS